VLAAAADINAAAAGVTATVTSAGRLVITANAVGGHVVAIGGAAATTFGLAASATGNGRSGQNIADTLNTQFNANTTLSAAGLKASWNSGSNQLTVSSDNNTYFRLNAGGTTATTGMIGFGTTGTANYAGPTVGNALNYVADAKGTTQTGALAFTAMTYGSDSQTVTVSAKDSTGALQSNTITLQNVGGTNATRTGRSIDEAISYINQQLQSSNNAVLQKVVAVKEDASGTPKINFVSSLTGFSVSFGASPSGNGFGAAGSTVAAAANGSGGNLAVDTQAGAAQAVSSIASAITMLGTAQGAVGQSQNQLNYAINLAQSQVDNFKAAESRIRDADVAADASNLSKAQVLQQATIAAMAQANTAPQAVLKLLG
jgi:flagellin